MNEEKIKTQLSALGADYLAERMIQLSYKYDAVEKEIGMIILKNDPKALTKKINQHIGALKRSTRYVPWNLTGEITDPVEQIAHSIEFDLLPADPALAITALEKLFNIDESLFNRMDDSNGELGDLYYNLSNLWGKACVQYQKNGAEDLVQRTFNLLLKNEYGTRDYLIKNSASALKETGLKALEVLIQKNEPLFSKYSLSPLYQSIADALGDVDKYIALIKNRSVLNDITICDIAKRLLAKWRSEEAIDYLLYQPNDLTVDGASTEIDAAKITYQNVSRLDLLIEAYEVETMLEEAQALRWLMFERYLSQTYYLGLIKHKKGAELESIQARAFQFATKDYIGSFNSILQFLSEIQAYEKIDQLIKNNFSKLDENDYSLYRPLSKTLANAGFPLSACILRRKLIDGILSGAKSKYYKYAVSDLKLSKNYADAVTDWCGFKTYDEYFDTLKEQHVRKSAFWSKLSV